MTTPHPTRMSTVPFVLAFSAMHAAVALPAITALAAALERRRRARCA